MNNPDHISESLDTIFSVKIPTGTYFDADPGSGMGKIRIGDPGSRIHPGSATQGQAKEAKYRRIEAPLIIAYWHVFLRRW
jgi:hypothetical protein